MAGTNDPLLLEVLLVVVFGKDIGTSWFNFCDHRLRKAARFIELCL